MPIAALSDLTPSYGINERWTRQPELPCSSAIPDSSQPIAGCLTAGAELAGQFDQPLGAS